MSKNRRKNQNVQSHMTLARAYATHLQTNPELHLSNVVEGQASDQEVQTDFRLWASGLYAAAQNPRLMGEITRLVREEGSGIGSGENLFGFISGQSGRETSRRSLFALSSTGGPTTTQTSTRTFDDVSRAIVSEYRNARSQTNRAVA